MTGETHERGNHVALISGGMDSAVAAHVSITDGPADLLVYLDTGTGLDSNREYVEQYADHLSVQLWTLRTHESYDEDVKDHGFPGPAHHQKQYTRLKERQIGRLATMTAGRGNKSDLHLWTGVRSKESDRRLKHVEEKDEGARWVFHSPIYDWTKDDCRGYMAEHDLPRNPLWDTLGRSGDCFCGCFGNPEEKIDLRAAGEGQHAEWIEQLEDTVELSPSEKERETWAWGGLTEQEQQRERARNDDAQMLLCSTCGVKGQTDQ